MISCKRINKEYIHLKNALLQLEENWLKKIPPLYPVMLWTQSASGLLCGETIWCSDACHTCCSAIDYIKLPLAHAISHIGKHVCCTGYHEKKKQAKKQNSACLPNLSLAIFYILERKMKLTVWKNVLVFFLQSSEKQLWSLLKPIAPSNVTSCLLQCFLRSQVATKPLWSRYKSHTITTGKNALWEKKKNRTRNDDVTLISPFK